MSNAPTPDIRSDAHQLIDALPKEATWDDVMYRVYVRQCIESGIKDADADHVLEVDEVRGKFGLTP